MGGAAAAGRGSPCGGCVASTRPTTAMAANAMRQLNAAATPPANGAAAPPIA